MDTGLYPHGDFLRINSTEDILFEKEELLLKELKEALLKKVEGVDNSLSGMIHAEMTKMNKLFEKLESRGIMLPCAERL